MAEGTEHETLEERLLHRMLFFSDAVFAIVVTLLALELRPPERLSDATPATLLRLLPHIGAFVFSFFIISIFWMAHMNTTRPIARFDWPTACANLLFLLPICMLPFATGWLGADISGALAFTLYSWVLVATSACNMLLVLVAYRGGGRLISGGASPAEVTYRMLRAAFPGLAFAIGLGGVAAGQVIPAHFCSLLIPLFFLLARPFRPRPAHA
jgi:uncharacterized membrane protein